MYVVILIWWVLMIDCYISYLHVLHFFLSNAIYYLCTMSHYESGPTKRIEEKILALYQSSYEIDQNELVRLRLLLIHFSSADGAISSVVVGVEPNVNAFSVKDVPTR